MPEDARGGTFFAVVGPSGAGKDSLIALARDALREDRRFLFVRRVVTRPADAAAEDHDSMPAEAFEEALRAGRFCVSWRAHGLSYGLPSPVVDHVRAGGHAVANCSRAALADICRVFPDTHVLSVAVDPEILEARLVFRGRETAGEVASRLARRVEPFPQGATVTGIDNSGELSVAAERFLNVLLAASGSPDPT